MLATANTGGREGRRERERERCTHQNKTTKYNGFDIKTSSSGITLLTTQKTDDRVERRKKVTQARTGSKTGKEQRRINEGKQSTCKYLPRFNWMTLH